MDKNILSYIDKTLDHMIYEKGLIEECVNTTEELIGFIRQDENIRALGRDAVRIQRQAERIEELVTQYLSIRLTLMELADSLGGEYKDYILAEEEKLNER